MDALAHTPSAPYFAVAEHLAVQAQGRNRRYARYHVRVCRVERDDSFDGDP